MKATRQRVILNLFQDPVRLFLGPQEILKQVQDDGG